MANAEALCHFRAARARYCVLLARFLYVMACLQSGARHHAFAAPSMYIMRAGKVGQNKDRSVASCLKQAFVAQRLSATSTRAANALVLGNGAASWWLVPRLVSSARQHDAEGRRRGGIRLRRFAGVARYFTIIIRRLCSLGSQPSLPETPSCRSRMAVWQADIIGAAATLANRLRRGAVFVKRYHEIITIVAR